MEENSMQEKIIQSFDIWTTAQGLKSKGRVKSVDNISLEGIARLRELILELAIRGKLVPQNKNDVSADILLSEIAEEKKQLTKQKLIKKTKKLPNVSDEEEGFSLPVGWAFARLNDIGDWGAGATPSRKNAEYYGGKIPWFKSGELSSDYISTSEETVTELALEKTSLRYNKIGDVLIAMYGATIGKTSILKVRGTTNQAVCACTTFSGIYNVYLLTFLKASKKSFINNGSGGAQPNISREKIIHTVIGIPPLEEQKRIVAKVDELMALCDKLEQQETNNLKTHQLLVKSLLQTLTQAKDADELHAAWKRLEEHFDTLFCTEDSIEQLKQTILQLAVMGKLVKQDPNDEPASKLLKKIAAEKVQLIKEGKLKKQKSLPAISEEEKPFDLPLGWCFVRLLDLCETITKGSSPKWQGVSYTDNPSDTLFITSENVGSYELILSNKKFVENKFNELEPRSILQFGDFLMNIVGGSIGRTAFFNLSNSANINQAVCLIRAFNQFIEPNYLLHFFNSQICISYMFSKQVDNARANLSMSNISKFIIPLPSLNEQKRIVNKVSELFSICDSLKEKIIKSQEIKNKLSKTIVEKALK